MKKIFAAGLSYKTAPVALREKHAVAPADQIAAARHLMQCKQLSEAVLLWTCNRVEIYGVSTDPKQDISEMLPCMAGKKVDVTSGIYCHEGNDAITHLFKVISGLDSMVLGETEITGQVKHAYENAHAAGITGKVLNKVFQKAMETAKAVRTKTNIGKGATSVGSVAVLHAQRIFGEQLAEKKVMVIGAGQMAEAVAKHLAKKGAREIIVANRTLETAQQLAKIIGGRAIAFADFVETMKDVDIIVSSTGCPVTIIHKPEVKKIMAERPERPLFFIDIAVPRDIHPDVAQVPNVHLFDIDALEATVQENVLYRQHDLDDCDAIIEEKLEELQPYLKRVLAGVDYVHVSVPENAPAGCPIAHHEPATV